MEQLGYSPSAQSTPSPPFVRMRFHKMPLGTLLACLHFTAQVLHPMQAFVSMTIPYCVMISSYAFSACTMQSW